MNVQIITQNNLPAFAVLPYGDYEQLVKENEQLKKQKNGDNLLFPQEVIDIKYDKGCSFVKAWRIYFKKTQKEVATALGMTQGAYSQIENADSNQRATLEKVAAVLGVDAGQLTLED